MNIVLTGILLILIANLAIQVTIFVKLVHYQRVFTQFITSPGENQPSPLAQVSQSFAGILSMSLKATLMGKASGEARQSQALERDIVLDTLDTKSPLMGGLLSMLGARTQNRLLKNPALIAGLVNLLTPKDGKTGAAHQIGFNNL